MKSIAEWPTESRVRLSYAYLHFDPRCLGIRSHTHGLQRRETAFSCNDLASFSTPGSDADCAGANSGRADTDGHNGYIHSHYPACARRTHYSNHRAACVGGHNG